MSVRNVMTKQNALATARERRRQLDRARGEQDQRIEAATAATLVALEGRAEAERALETAQASAATALRAILAEDVSISRAAALLDLDMTEVRRMLKATPTMTPSARATATATVATRGRAG